MTEVNSLLSARPGRGIFQEQFCVFEETEKLRSQDSWFLSFLTSTEDSPSMVHSWVMSDSGPGEMV